MHDALGADADDVVVQAMIPPGLDLRIRSTVDERIGPLVAVGLGGSTADLVADEPSRLAPLSSAGAAALLAASRAGPALDAAGLPSDPVVDTLLRVAQLVTDHPEVVSGRPQPDRRLGRSGLGHRRDDRRRAGAVDRASSGVSSSVPLASVR